MNQAVGFCTSFPPVCLARNFRCIMGRDDDDRVDGQIAGVRAVDGPTGVSRLSLVAGVGECDGTLVLRGSHPAEHPGDDGQTDDQRHG